MAQWDKLLSKIKSLDKDMRFAELKKKFCKVMVILFHNRKVEAVITLAENQVVIQ